MQVLSLQEVDKRFDNGLLALAQATLELAAGEFVALLGPSGCGKSTLLRLAAGLEPISAGHIDAPALRASAAAQTAFVFQDATLMPWADVHDNVWLPLRLAGIGRAAARARIAQALAAVGLADFAHAYPNELSGGMKMRVSIARALVTRPRLILMDEPFAALDEITRFKLNSDLLAMREKLNCTVIFVTHSVFESVFLSDRIVIMAARPGRVIRELGVDEPYPRTEDFRTSTDYVAHCRAASEALAVAMQGVAHEG
jgi:NitT/TauT family transport system ATP-binding protein